MSRLGREAHATYNRAAVSTTFQNLIGDSWQPSRSGATFTSVSPANHEEVIGEFPASGSADVDAAVAAAGRAFPAWSAMPAPKRGEILFRIARLFQDYDWADEVLHARIGRVWYVSQFNDDTAKAAEYGSACWSKVVSDWEQWRKDGLTGHRNWWPGLYREHCRIHGIEPDEKALAFNTTYAATRADLQRIAASG